jgi:2-C-methyl-D-erythritol 2,4-cyclodiphosphate synthase
MYFKTFPVPEVVMFKSGIGIDMRPFAEGKPLVLAGARIDYAIGLAGDYDSDVVSLAVVDALLGASNLGEKYELFPETDAKYQNISGMRLLELVRLRLTRIALEIENIDIIVVCPEVNLSQYKTYMLLNLSHALEIDSSMISIKQAHSFENLIPEFKKGVAAMATCMLVDVSGSGDEEQEGGTEEEYYE